MSTEAQSARTGERGYEPPYIPDAYDEALDPDGRPRPGYEDVIPALLEAELEPISERIAEFFEREGVEFASNEGSLEFHVDPVPRILTASEWDLLERGLRQRADALNAFIRDAYSDQRIVREGRVPARVIETAEFFEPEMVGVDLPERPASVVGFGVIRGDSGEFAVLEDNCRTPSGMAYMLAARAAIDAYVPLTPPGERRDALLLVEQLGDALRDAAPGGDGDPSIALLTDGPENSGWFDHRSSPPGFPAPGDALDPPDAPRGRPPPAPRRPEDLRARRARPARGPQPGRARGGVADREQLSGRRRQGHLGARRRLSRLVGPIGRSGRPPRRPPSLQPVPFLPNCSGNPTGFRTGWNRWKPATSSG